MIPHQTNRTGTTMQTVGIREFRTNLHKYTRQLNEPLTITAHGEPIGYYIPIGKRPEDKDFEALLSATRKMSAMLQERGISEDEIIADFRKARRAERNGSDE